MGATTFMATSSKTSDEDKDEEKKSERQERKAEFSQLNCKGIRLQNETNMSAQKVDREVKVKRKKRVMSVEKVGEIERDVHDTEWEEGDGIIVEVSYTEEEEEEEKEEAKVENLSNNRSLKAEEVLFLFCFLNVIEMILAKGLFYGGPFLGIIWKKRALY